MQVHDRVLNLCLIQKDPVVEGLSAPVVAIRRTFSVSDRNRIWMKRQTVRLYIINKLIWTYRRGDGIFIRQLRKEAGWYAGNFLFRSVESWRFSDAAAARCSSLLGKSSKFSAENLRLSPDVDDISSAFSPKRATRSVSAARAKVEPRPLDRTESVSTSLEADKFLARKKKTWSWNKRSNHL